MTEVIQIVALVVKEKKPSFDIQHYHPEEKKRIVLSFCAYANKCTYQMYVMLREKKITLLFECM